jgi:glucose-1-phosphate thymidylyltransferase
LNDATEFVKAVEKRTSLKIACIEEIAFRMGYIDKITLEERVGEQGKSTYGAYLKRLLQSLF